MPAKLQPNAFPKAMVSLRDSLGDDLNVDNLQRTDAALRSKAFVSLRQELQQKRRNKWTEYRQLQKDADKRKWLINYIIDPASGGSTVTNETSRSTVTEENEMHVWVTLDELSGPRFYNSRRLAELAIVDMESRPHEKPNLAKHGVLQYKGTVAHDVYKKLLEEKASAQTAAQVTADQAITVRDHMASGTMEAPTGKRSRDGDNTGGGRTGRRNLKIEVDLTPEEIEPRNYRRCAWWNKGLKPRLPRLVTIR
eukprot:TRINITY_DN27764_c0_g1_i1.p1 TRINITY_DN27764_c0_g1~~TRINITY_DN27764_c0_g1_i1.p1  ORF type:complete len:260 (-),score=50.56 TRINITY_DN27764_c0_g1_i1:137-892(-)